MYQIISIEDDPAEEEILRHHIERFSRESGEELALTWFKTAAEFLERHRPADLILMDIDLPGISGMEAATLMRSYDGQTPLIFVTNLAQLAIKGYEVDALDFVVKPVGYHDFTLRMRKALRVMRHKAGQTLTVTSREGTCVFSTNDLSYVEVMDHELTYLVEGIGTVRARGSLRELEAALEDHHFCRISNSCLVNMEHIRQVRRDRLVMSDGVELFFSRSRKRPAMETIAAFLGGSL